MTTKKKTISRKRTLDEVFKKPFKQIRYEVTGAYGEHAVGEIIPAILLVVEPTSGIGLVYHPADKARHECGSLDFCHCICGNTWESVNTDVFLNLK